MTKTIELASGLRVVGYKMKENMQGVVKKMEDQLAKKIARSFGLAIN